MKCEKTRLSCACFSDPLSPRCLLFTVSPPQMTDLLSSHPLGLNEEEEAHFCCDLRPWFIFCQVIGVSVMSSLPSFLRAEQLLLQSEAWSELTFTWGLLTVESCRGKSVTDPESCLSGSLLWLSLTHSFVPHGVTLPLTFHLWPCLLQVNRGSSPHGETLRTGSAACVFVWLYVGHRVCQVGWRYLRVYLQ